MQAIHVEQLTKTYSNGKKALNGINLDVQQGDFFGLIGPNGAGKTTLIGTLTTLLRKTHGHVVINGFDLDTHPSQAKQTLSVVPQEMNFHIFATPLQILIAQAGYYGISAKAAKPHAIELLQQLRLEDKQHQQARLLSGGMKRRLMIARALINRPKLLFLDEPTAGVDIEIRSETWKMLQQLNAAGTTIVLTTHYMEEAEALCNRIGLIHQGRIIETTSPQAMLAKRQHDAFVLDLACMPDTLPSISGLQLSRINAQQAQLTLSQGQSLSQALALLQQHQLDVVSLKNAGNRLEQYITHFIEPKS